jgi:DNA adenine methylase
MISVIPYIGGKHRIAGRLAEYLRATGADTLVDVFGGSAAVLLNSGFKKRIYNDISGDLVCLFRVLADSCSRGSLLKRLRWMPASRQVWNELSRGYVAHLFSFGYFADPIERAAATFFRHQFSFGGKGRSGGLSISTLDRHGIKEIVRYQGALRRMARLGKFFHNTMIENLDYADCVSLYGIKSNCVLFIDPPYVGTECYYPGRRFSQGDHVFLANQLAGCKAAVVCTYYDHPLIRDLYPSPMWRWENIVATKNSQFRGKNKSKMLECILIKGGAADHQKVVPENKSREDTPQLKDATNISHLAGATLQLASSTARHYS